MRLKLPKNDAKYEWTNHVFGKMLFYGLTEGRIRRVMASPKRSEEGVAPETIAVMQPGGSKKNPQEIWVMFQVLKNKKRRIITAWRYPGISKARAKIPIPNEILAELDSII